MALSASKGMHAGLTEWSWPAFAGRRTSQPTPAARPTSPSFPGAEGAAMNALTKSLHMFLSQDGARQNAAKAARQVGRERQQRAEVEAFLAQADGRPPSTAPAQAAVSHRRI
jgi:hypothetical protein